MFCENCKNVHDGSYGSGRFCSQSCARKYSCSKKSKECFQKISEKLKGKPAWSKDFRYLKNDYVIICEKCGTSFIKNLAEKYFQTNRFIKICKKCKNKNKYLNQEEKRIIQIKNGKKSSVTRLNNYKTLSIDKAPYSEKIRRILEKQDYKCLICKISEWNKKPIKLQIHHIDGNKNNNSVENLQFLCPNCHSQTENFTSKNSLKNKMNGNVLKITDEMIIEALKTSSNIRQILNKIGINNSRSSYQRVFNLLKNNLIN